MAKIILTGGPCGGKTNSIELIKDKLNNNGYKTTIIPETADALLKLGFLAEYPLSNMEFQELLFMVQFLNEYKLEQCNDILLCDRGIFDALAYLDRKDFENILMRTKTSFDTIFKTYNKALYFKTIAYIDPKSFSIERPYETPESAIIREKKLLEIWRKILLNNDCPYTEKYNDKVKYIYGYLENYLLYSNIETIKLSDFYESNYIRLFEDGISDLLEKNNIPYYIRQKTKELIL